MALRITTGTVRWLWIPAAALCALALYLSLVFVASALGGHLASGKKSNALLDFSVMAAPWSPDVLVTKAEHLRAYAIAQDLEYRKVTMDEVVTLMERAISLRPYWPYYQLGALDAEYLAGKEPAVIQQRLDVIMSLVPNERGLDRNLIELSLLAWRKLRTDQKRWVAQRISTSTHATQRQAQLLLGRLIADDRIYCAELPWSLVRSHCHR